MTSKLQFVVLALKANYVLGRANDKTGYFDLETKEANSIIWRRVSYRKKKLKSEMVVERCCCDSAEKMSEKIAEHAKLTQLYEIT